MKNGKIKQTIDNVLLILNNDPRLCGRFMLNEFSGRGEVLYPLPWDKDPDKFKRRAWADSDISAMYWYMEKRIQDHQAQRHRRGAGHPCGYTRI